MGNTKSVRLAVLIALLLVVALVVHRPAERAQVSKPRDLQTVFGPVEGYQLVARTPLEPDVYRFLDLDDYVAATYGRADGTVGLYIGYYYTLDKVSAAHSPLVCFPGQGWSIDQPRKGQLQVGKHTIHYAEITASLEGRKELILYWYQAGESTAPEVYRNKLSALVNKLTGKSQQHAFVRVSVPYNHTDIEQARQLGQAFIAMFYPRFIDYIHE